SANRSRHSARVSHFINPWSEWALVIVRGRFIESLAAVAAIFVVQCIKGPLRVDRWTIFKPAESTGFPPRTFHEDRTQTPRPRGARGIGRACHLPERRERLLRRSD